MQIADSVDHDEHNEEERRAGEAGAVARDLDAARAEDRVDDLAEEGVHLRDQK